ncbi:uncharacterized protein BO87DRAFT_86446 [Aspergillus neoniger CBS 115656]|uniref:Uncharacterized protein n=1 Tax=Aspergillus neoniger (strain CBS 115656) TaxID=1448310 RepID=A0A318Z9Y7_ASPNB|nr:hypothetical protein BO87DRAFT_86446 [Aspergillus neoniger CBS 115656]PYH33312.1 hypothetical protein BO87DRAFT_86446 [Aspergillus neoniger CBS 115656]
MEVSRVFLGFICLFLYVVWISMIRLPFGFRLYFWCRYMLLNLMPWYGLKICLFLMFLLQYHVVQLILADPGGLLFFALRSTSVDLEVTWLLNCHVYCVLLAFQAEHLYETLRWLSAWSIFELSTSTDKALSAARLCVFLRDIYKYFLDSTKREYSVFFTL